MTDYLFTQVELQQFQLDQRETVHAAHGRRIRQWDFWQNDVKTDIVLFLNEFQPILVLAIQKIFERYRGFKLWLILTVEYKSEKIRELPPFVYYLQSMNYLFFLRPILIIKFNQFCKKSL